MPEPNACRAAVLMSEWFKEHAWKAKRASHTERFRNTATRTISDLTFQDDHSVCIRKLIDHR
jgi:hypothetical protein